MEMLQKNTQLKEENKRYRKLGFKHLNERNEKLESVLKEIREYIKNTNFWGIYEDIPMSEVKYGDDILEIIDKGIGAED